MWLAPSWRHPGPPACLRHDVRDQVVLVLFQAVELTRGAVRVHAVQPGGHQDRQFVGEPPEVDRLVGGDRQQDGGPGAAQGLAGQHAGLSGCPLRPPSRAAAGHCAAFDGAPTSRCRAARRPVRSTRAVRRQQGVRRAQQGRVSRQRLSPEGVQSRAAELPGREQFGHGLLVHLAAPRHVDDQRTPGQQGQLTPAEDAPGLRGERSVHGHRAGARQQVVEVADPLSAGRPPSSRIGS